MGLGVLDLVVQGPKDLARIFCHLGDVFPFPLLLFLFTVFLVTGCHCKLLPCSKEQHTSPLC